VYIRMSEEENHARVDGGGFTALRRGSPGAPLVVAVGPTLRPVLEATADRDVSLAYLATVRPFPHEGVRVALADGTDVVLVEPYQAGTSAAEISVALRERPHRLLALGVPNAEFRHYGTGEEHRAAHGLDAAGITRSLDDFLGAG
jgi:transketolase